MKAPFSRRLRLFTNSKLRDGDFRTLEAPSVISVFRSSDYIEAQLIAGLLQEHGIGVFVQGALLQGGIGELPAMGHLSILIDETDRIAATRLVEAYERGDLAITDEDTE